MRVPMLRGRITGANGVPAEKVTIDRKARWVLRGDRGITYSATCPENATLTDGTWWPADYSGEPLVSFSARRGRAQLRPEARRHRHRQRARPQHHRPGSPISAKCHWESLTINFVMVFSPNTFAGAPHAWLATLTSADATVAEEAAILNRVTRAYPAVTTVRVKDALDIVNRLVAQLGEPFAPLPASHCWHRSSCSPAPLAAGNRARIHDAVVLKTLGATRRTLIAAFCWNTC